MSSKRLSLLVLVVILLAAGSGSEAKVDAVQGAPQVSELVEISVSNVHKYSPAMAYNPNHNEYLVVWENDRGATWDIYARRVAGDGTLLTQFTIDHTPNMRYWQPDVVYNPVHDEYLVVYTADVPPVDYDVYARRISWNGGWMSAPYHILEGPQRPGRQWVPAVAYNFHMDEYLVVYENYISNARRDIAAQRLKVKGTSLERHSWRNIAGEPNEVRLGPDVAFNEALNEYLIAYTYKNPTNGDIRGRITTWNMGDLRPEIYVVPNVNDQGSVALASLGDEYLAVWNDGPVGPARDTIYGQRIRGNGDLLGYIKICDVATENHVEPAVAFSPVHGYLVTWRQSGVDNIWGRKLVPFTNELDGDRFAIEGSVGSQRAPAVACSYTGTCFVAMEYQFEFSMYNIWGRFVLAHRVLLPIVIR